MLNPNSRSNVHMTPARYRRVILLLERLRAWNRSQEFFAREFYSLLAKKDRGQKERAAIFRFLRNQGVVRFAATNPIRYRVAMERLDNAAVCIQSALDEASRVEQRTRVAS